MTTNTDLQRDLGRVEGEISAVKSRLDKIDGVLERIDSRLARIEIAENQRKGAFNLAHWIVGGVGAGIALLVDHLWK